MYTVFELVSVSDIELPTRYGKVLKLSLPEIML
jgi:hypothetical protein